MIRHKRCRKPWLTVSGKTEDRGVVKNDYQLHESRSADGRLHDSDTVDWLLETNVTLADMPKCPASAGHWPRDFRQAALLGTADVSGKCLESRSFDGKKRSRFQICFSQDFHGAHVRRQSADCFSGVCRHESHFRAAGRYIRYFKCNLPVRTAR